MNLHTLELHDLASPPAWRAPRTLIRLALSGVVALGALGSMLLMAPAWQTLCVVLPVLGLLPELVR